ncbi:MAG: ABC transporter substrate-binding protein, partial [Halobacteriaceae archaeon]
TEMTTTSGGSTMQSDSMSISQAKSPLDFDPVKANDVPSLQVVQRVHETLYTFGKGTNVVPKIAKGEPEISKNGKRWVVLMNSR